jgi:hypothetical protein
MNDAEELLYLIEKDLDLYEDGCALENCGWVLRGHPEVGTIVPLNWLEDYPDLQDAWAKYIEGRAFLPSGFYVTDVRHFLSSKIRRHE